VPNLTDGRGEVAPAEVADTTSRGTFGSATEEGDYPFLHRKLGLSALVARDRESTLTVRERWCALTTLSVSVPRDWVGTVGGEAASRDCFQCGTCSGVCPLVDYMDHNPRQLIAMLRAGRSDILRCNAIWVCTSCYACTVACPHQVPLTDLIYVLKRAAMRDGAYPRRFPTPVMARQFVRSVDRWGRSTESRISISFYLKTDPTQLLRHAWLGLRLLQRGRMSLRRESVPQPTQIRTMLEALEATTGQAA